MNGLRRPTLSDHHPIASVVTVATMAETATMTAIGRESGVISS